MTREQLEELAREERRAYLKEWRAANPEKVRKHRINYWFRRMERKLDEEEAAKEEKHE